MRYLRLLPVAVATMLAAFGVENAQAQASSITVAGVQYKLCGSENDNCTFSGTGSVVFGAVPPNAPSSMLTSPRTFTNGVGCYVGAVSQSDPAYGYGKVMLGPRRDHRHPAGDHASRHNTAGYDTTGYDAASYNAAGDHSAGYHPASYNAPRDNSASDDPHQPGSSAISCGTPTQTAGGTANGLISADTPTTDGLRIFQNNAPFKLAITTNSPSADTVVWSVADSNGAIKTQGSFAVKSGVQTATIRCTSTWSGYGALTATLQSQWRHVAEPGHASDGYCDVRRFA